MPDFSRSLTAHDRARLLIPGGVNSPARAFGGVGGKPITIARGEGAYLWDVDGNRYIDYCGSWGPLILGHCHSRVIEAVSKALYRGSSFGAPTELESELAETVIRAVPSIEKVRFVSSGTEAAMSAIRLARGFTGRDKIIKFAGCYHGHTDSMLVQAGSSATTLGVPSSPGVPAGCTRDTIVVEFNDIAAVENALAANAGQVAAVILEPVVGNMGLVLPRDEFLAGLRDLTKSHASLLVFDEVITGFRVALGGAQEYFGVSPDLTVLGKIVGGGLPVGAFGGRADIMDKVMPVGPVFQAGTLSGNPLAMASGIATLSELRDYSPYGRLERLTTRLVRGLHEAAHDAGVAHTLPHLASLFTLFFNPAPVRNYTDAKRSDAAAFGRFFWAMVERGVYLPCSQFEAAFVSAAHTDADIEYTIAAAREALKPVPTAAD
jgi:glutamate-1-semialdehyde 2,1-aminomutase